MYHECTENTRDIISTWLYVYEKISDYRSNIYHKRNSSSTVHDRPFIYTNKSINNYVFWEKAFTLILDNMTHGHKDANVILLKRLKA